MHSSRWKPGPVSPPVSPMRPGKPGTAKKKPRQTEPTGVDGGRNALAVDFGGGSWMSLQPGSNRLLPLVAGLRYTALPTCACHRTGSDRLLPLFRGIKTTGARSHADFQSRSGTPFGDPGIAFWTMKGGRQPTSGRYQRKRPQALCTQASALANSDCLRFLTLVHNCRLLKIDSKTLTGY